MDALSAYLNSLDATEWLGDISGTLFMILMLRYLYTRINVGDTYSDSRTLEYAVLFTGVAWGALLAYDWALPVITSVYVVNASDDSYAVATGDSGFCLPGKSYYHVSWRVDPPKAIKITSTRTEAQATDVIGKGEWFVNTSAAIVSVDLIDYNAKSINPDALALQQSGSIRVNVGESKPFQLYSQLPLDRVSFGSGDILDRHDSLPCPPVTPP